MNKLKVTKTDEYANPIEKGNDELAFWLRQHDKNAYQEVKIGLSFTEFRCSICWDSLFYYREKGKPAPPREQLLEIYKDMLNHYNIYHEDASLLFRKTFLEDEIERLQEEWDVTLFGTDYFTQLKKREDELQMEEKSIEINRNIRNMAVGMLQQLIIIYYFKNAKRSARRDVAYYVLSKEYKLMPRFIAYILFDDTGKATIQIRTRIYNGMKIQSGNQFPDWWIRAMQ